MQTHISKERLTAFSDGVIAIIITIMVLELPYPANYSYEQIKNFILGIFIFLDSFSIVGLYWHKHCVLVENIKEVNGKIVWHNLLFLFTISLFPLFTKWVIADFGQIIPAIGYILIFMISEWSLNVFVSSLDIVPKTTLSFKGKIPKIILTILLIILILLFIYYFPYIASILLISFPLLHTIRFMVIDNKH